MWSPYHGTKPGDLPKLFVAGCDALAMIVPAVEARLRKTQALEELSKATDGSF
jgi:hypothetical protein